MTPLAFMPSAPPSRPVTPAGGGVADPPSSSSFERALQRAGAADDGPRADTTRSDATSAGRQTPDKPAAKSSDPAKRSQDDADSKGSTASDAPTTKADRTREDSRPDVASEKRDSKEAQQPAADDGQPAVAVAPVNVQVPVPVPVVTTEPVDVAAVSTRAADAKSAAWSSVKTSALHPSDAQNDAPKGKAESRKASDVAGAGKVVNDATRTESVETIFDEPVDSAVRKEPAAAQTRLQSATVQRADASKPSSQAARTLLADALQRASQGTQAARAAQDTPSQPQAVAETAAATVTATVKSSTPGTPAPANAPEAKAAAKARTPVVDACDVAVTAAGTTSHEGTTAGNGGTSTGSGRHEGAPTPHAKAEAPVSWPTAFAVRVPEAMSSSLERTGSAAPALPSSVTQQDLSTVGPQLVRGLQLQARAGGGDMKMTLNPEHLGSVTIEVQVRHDRVSATLTAETPEVRQWIAAHQADLKNSLASVGLSLEDLVVKDEGGGGRQDARGDERQSQSGRRQPAPEQNETQFEVNA